MAPFTVGTEDMACLIVDSILSGMEKVGSGIRDIKILNPGTLFVRLREELEGVPVSRQKMKLVSLFMDEIRELVEDPAKARYKPIIAEFGLNVIHSWYNFKGNLCNDFLISYRLSFYVAEAVR